MTEFEMEADARLRALEDLIAQVAADVAAEQPESGTARLIDDAEIERRDIGDEERDPANFMTTRLLKLLRLAGAVRDGLA